MNFPVASSADKALMMNYVWIFLLTQSPVFRHDLQLAKRDLDVFERGE
jgi:hypothetical protein